MSEIERWEHHRRARALMDLRRYDAAAEIYTQLLGEDPEDPRGWQLLAETYTAAGDPARALDALDRALALDPTDALTLVHRCEALLDLGRIGHALESAERAVEIRPNWSAAHVARARGLMRWGRTDDALDEVHEALRLSPDDVGAMIVASVIALERRDAREAERWSRQALAIAPNEPSALNNLGVALDQQGRHGEAVDLYQQALRVDTGGARSQALARENLGRSASAWTDPFQRIPAPARIALIIVLVLVGWPFLLGALLLRRLVMLHNERRLLGHQPEVRAVMRETRKVASPVTVPRSPEGQHRRRMLLAIGVTVLVVGSTLLALSVSAPERSMLEAVLGFAGIALLVGGTAVVGVGLIARF